MVAVALVRHGQTEWNAGGLIQGSSDIPLNAAGRAQAAAAAATLLAFGDGAPWRAVVTSPLRRAVQTGLVLADILGVPVWAPVPGLRERHYGLGEGRSDAWAEAHYPAWDFPEAESPLEVLTRARAAVLQLASWADAAVPAVTHIVAVTHGGVIQSLLRDVTGEPVPDIPNGGVRLIRVEEDRTTKLSGLVETKAVRPDTTRYGDLH
jgi:uncharacterized phosphatase